MRTVGFFASSLALALFIHLLGLRYVSFFGVSPDIMLLLVMTLGLQCGPVSAQTMGFLGGLALDSAGGGLFGLQAFSLTAVGYAAGMIRRRMASERLTAQWVSALAATVLNTLLNAVARNMFEESAGRTTVQGFAVALLFNLALVNGMFLFMERWAALWRVEAED